MKIGSILELPNSNEEIFRYFQGYITKNIDKSKEYIIGWNTSAYLGIFDSKLDYLVSFSENWQNMPSYDKIEISFNLLLIEKIINEDIKIEDIWLNSGNDFMFQNFNKNSSKLRFQENQIFSFEIKFLGNSIKSTKDK